VSHNWGSHATTLRAKAGRPRAGDACRLDRVGTLRADTLLLRDNDAMRRADFEDGEDVRAPSTP
jgi:hypothetical protein